MGKWLAGIAATVIAALIVWWITAPTPPTPPPRPSNGDAANFQPPRYDPYESFLSAATTSEARDPLQDDRVKTAIRLTLRGEDLNRAKMLMAEAGWTNGFAVTLLMSQFAKHGGSAGEARVLATKLSRIGVRLIEVK